MRRLVGPAIAEPRALVLLSGGIDSAVALAWSRREGHEIVALTFDYHDRPEPEEGAIAALLSRFGVRRRRVVPMPFLRDVADVQGAENAALREAPEGYIPARNLAFYALAAHFAEIDGARHVVGGHNAGDGETFPDASEAFFRELNGLLRLALATYRRQPVEILVPLIRRSKPEVIRLGIEMGVRFEETWSCYRGGETHCGTCPGCEERREAFAKAGVEDSTRYSRKTF